MGFGGILAALAQGFGDSLVVTAKQAWEKEAEDRKYKAYKEENDNERAFRTAEAEKERAFRAEEAKEERAFKAAEADKERRNAIAVASMKAREDSSQNMQDVSFVQDSLNAIKANKAIIDGVDQQLKEATDKEVIAKLNKKKEAAIAHNKAISNNSKLLDISNSGRLGEEIKVNIQALTSEYRTDEQQNVASKPTVERPTTDTQSKPERTSPKLIDYVTTRPQGSQQVKYFRGGYAPR